MSFAADGCTQEPITPAVHDVGHRRRGKRQWVQRAVIGGHSQLRMLVLAEGFGTPIAEVDPILWRVSQVVVTALASSSWQIGARRAGSFC